MTTIKTIVSRIVTSLKSVRIARVRSDLGDSVSSGYGPFEAQPATATAIVRRAAEKLARVKLMLRGGFITRLQSVRHCNLGQLFQSGYGAENECAEESGRDA